MKRIYGKGNGGLTVHGDYYIVNEELHTGEKINVHLKYEGDDEWIICKGSKIATRNLHDSNVKKIQEAINEIHKAYAVNGVLKKDYRTHDYKYYPSSINGVCNGDTHDNGAFYVIQYKDENGMYHALDELNPFVKD